MEILDPTPVVKASGIATATRDERPVEEIVFLSNRKANSEELFTQMGEQLAAATGLPLPRIVHKNGPGDHAPDDMIREIADPGVYVIVGTGD